MYPRKEEVHLKHSSVTQAEPLWGKGRNACVLSCVQLFATPWTIAHQAEPPWGKGRNACVLSCVQLFATPLTIAHQAEPPWGKGRNACVLSCVQLFVIPWTIAHQAPPSMEFSRQEYWSGLPFPPLGDLPNPGIEPGSPALLEDSLVIEPPEKPKGRNTEVQSLRSKWGWIWGSEGARTLPSV